MGKSSRAKKRTKNIIGKGKVTPTQIAFMVDRYLHEHSFFDTRNVFRYEASSLLSKSPFHKVPESLIPLDDILNEYICFKEERMVVEQERVRLDQEKIRFRNLLEGMHNVINTYNSSSITPPPPPPVVAPDTQTINDSITSSGCAQYNTPSVMPVSLNSNKRMESDNISTPLASQAITGKRKGPVVAPPVSRKPRTTTAQGKSTANAIMIPQADNGANHMSSQAQSETQSLAKNSAATNELMSGNGSSVEKCLFRKADSSIPTSSTCLRTPQKHASNCPQKEQEVTKERFTIGPLKQITSYTMERSHLASSSVHSNKRDHMRGRLNFYDTDTEKFLETPANTAPLVATSSSGSDPEVDWFDMDFSDLDFMGETFEISDLLDDFDLASEGNTLNAPIETASGLSLEQGIGYLEPDQNISEYLTTFDELIQGNDMSTQENDANNTAATKILNEIYMDLESCQFLQAESPVTDK